MFIGIVGEVFLAFKHYPESTDIGYWGPVWADVAVALGVGIEVLFGFRGSALQSELTRRSNERLGKAEKEAAEANERAAKADLARAELEQRLMPRELTQKQFECLQGLKGKVSKIAITTPSDFEATRYAAQIALALKHADIDVMVAPQRIGMIWSELYIVIPEPVPTYTDVPLYAAFSKAGFSVGCGPRTNAPMADLPIDVPILMVGVKKPMMGNIPPFMAGIGSPKDSH